MKSKKVTMLVAALVVAVVAAAGIGYATATVYKAETTNANNSIDVTYIRLSQDGDAAYTAATSFIDGNYFNTVTTSNADNGTTYTVTGDVTVTVAQSTNAFVISNGDLILKLESTETTAQSQTPADYVLRIKTSTNLGTASGVSYYFGLDPDTSNSTGDNIIWCTAAGNYDSGFTTWEISSVPSGAVGSALPYTVVVAASGSTTTAPTPVSNISFIFEASTV